MRAVCLPLCIDRYNSNSYPAPDRLDRYFLFSVNLFQIRVPERIETELVSLAEQQDIIETRQQAAEAARKAMVPVLPRSSLQVRECPLDKVMRFDDRNPLKDAE